MIRDDPAYGFAHLRSRRNHSDIIEYLERIQATLDPFAGRFVIHGPPADVLEGTWPGSMVLIEFPSLADARAWYDSPPTRPFCGRVPITSKVTWCWSKVSDRTTTRPSGPARCARKPAERRGEKVAAWEWNSRRADIRSVVEILIGRRQRGILVRRGRGGNRTHVTRFAGLSVLVGL